MDEASAKEMLNWLASKMSGTVTVKADGSREPQICWGFPIDLMYMHGPSPLEAIQAAYEADKHRTTTNQ